MILVAVFVAVLGTSTFFIINHYKEANKQAELYGELAELVDAAAQTNAATEPLEQIPYSEEKMLLPELAELYQQNGDLVGWISIADTNINYPVMQSVNEPNFYLKHGFDKEYSDYGCPYVQEDCDVQEPSDNLVIYGHQMSGIFIYTASGDSEGTMGGLVRQGYADTFPGIFKKAMEESMTCSNDPVCSLSMGQGRDSLNLSACYSCCLIPETSCEEFNIFLDRGTIVGTYENREMGFYSKQLHGAAPWKENSVSEDNNEARLRSRTHVIITDQGTDLRDSAYAEIWKDLKTWAVDAKERALLSELENSSDLFLLKEKPYRDCIFQIGGNEEQYKCDLFWKESQVALFTSDNEDCYEVARNCDIYCIYCADDTVTVRKILDALKGR